MGNATLLRQRTIRAIGVGDSVRMANLRRCDPLRSGAPCANGSGGSLPLIPTQHRLSLAALTYRIFGQFGRDFRAGQSELIYALHPPSLKLDPSTIRWTAVNIQPPVTSSPQIRETLILDQDHELTVLEGEYFASAIVVDGKTCNLADTSSPKPQRQK